MTNIEKLSNEIAALQSEVIKLQNGNQSSAFFTKDKQYIRSVPEQIRLNQEQIAYSLHLLNDLKSK